ncbi:MAG: hypothetical protein BGO79_03700 [Delftia sp. 67-8]|nr:MAG: hypothetical protein BGO79_03700 [Delftia sp. 67-8]
MQSHSFPSTLMVQSALQAFMSSGHAGCAQIFYFVWFNRNALSMKCRHSFKVLCIPQYDRKILLDLPLPSKQSRSKTVSQPKSKNCYAISMPVWPS